MATSLSWPQLIKELGRGATGSRDLTTEDAAALYSAMLAGEVPELELGAISIALRMKGESAGEMLGFHRAMQAHCANLPLPQGRFAAMPVVIPTYNGARKEANLTPLLALLLRSLDVPVLLHGMAESHGRVTSREILAALGVAPADSLASANQQLADTGVTYLDLPQLAPGLADLLALRARLGLRSSAHSLVKMLDPFTAQSGAAGQGLLLAAATHPDYLVAMRELLLAQQQAALLLRATEGEPYANPRRQPRLEWLHAGMSEVLLEAEQGSVASLPDLPVERDIATTVAWTEAVLAGRQVVPPVLSEQIAACLVATGRATEMASARSLLPW
jgi:anthranilate phosphoribosyltransferase